MDRKPISKRTRFEVFKRDAFECQYCGAHPPGVLLHVDHIVAVANGGGNEMDNLITACEPCNLGKSSVDLNVTPQSLAAKAALVAEREAQLAGYHEIMEARRARIEADAWRVANELFYDADENGVRRDYMQSIRMFNERLGLHCVMEAATIARSRLFSESKMFRYFCGICWSRIREQDGPGS